jgi:hypothetical protein
MLRRKKLKKPIVKWPGKTTQTGNNFNFNNEKEFKEI